jgi:hypothetical protein
MIKSRTTLILGAGASAPYGFPIGSALRDQLLLTDQEFVTWTRNVGRDGDEWLRVQSILHDFQPESIDDFLRMYGEHADLVKMAIARQLSKFESVKAHVNVANADPWYRTLLDEVLGNDVRLGGGMLSIVTFNYDLSLEAYLVTTLMARHRITRDEAIAALSALQIQHIYGDLGPTQLTHGHGREYLPFANIADLQVAANGISTCFEPKSRDAVMKARKLIEQSSNVLFLGFAYSHENLKRLDLSTCIQPHTNIVASVFLCPGGFDRLRGAIGGVPMTLKSVDTTSEAGVATRLAHSLFLACT